MFYRINKIQLIIRHAKKDKVITFAKLFGITLSFAIVLFVARYVYFEFSFDKFIPDHERIYRCLMQGKLNGRDADFAVTSPEMAKVVVEDIPEICEAIRMFKNGKASVRYEDQLYEGGRLISCDSNFFSFFSIPIKKELQNPFESDNNLTITRSLAIKYFGTIEDALNKQVRIRGENYIVTGVFDDLPKNFHLHFDIARSIVKMNPDKIGWHSQSYYTYIKTSSDDINIDDLNLKLSKTVYKHSDSEFDSFDAKCLDDLRNSDKTYIFYTAEPLKDIHFALHKFDPAVTSNKLYVYGAIILAALVLVISSLNYITLFLANLTSRFKEIGVFKICGANKKNIINFFVLESLTFWVVSFILSIILYEVISNPLANYLGIEFDVSSISFIKIIIVSFIAIVLINLFVTIFPVFYLSKRKTISLKDGADHTNSHFSIRKSFIFFQFALAGLIIISSIIVQKQISFMINKDRGYDTENVLILSMLTLDEDEREVFMNELRSFSVISNVSSSDSYFGEDPSMSSAYFENLEEENYFHTSIMDVDIDFMSVFDFKMLEGRFFEKDRKSDFKAVVINEAAAKEYKHSGSIFGKEILFGSNDLYEVIGIVKDFNFRSLHHQVQPLVMFNSKNQGNVFIKIRNDQIQEGLNIVKKQWNKFNIPYPFNYEFHDEVIIAHYKQDQQAKKLLLVLSIISITIACIGLYAISYFVIIKRTKEIGIRKVNGSKTVQIINMLNVSFVRLVVFAFLTACPIAVYLSNKWLQNFAYKTEVNWWIFLFAGCIAIIIALFTVSWQSWLVANKNPIEALRYE